MSAIGMISSNISHLANVQSNWQKVQSEFKQLGQDLQAGNLAQAQTDFVTLSQSLASNQQTGTTTGAASPSIPPNFVPPNAVTQSQAGNSPAGSHHRVHFRQALSQLGQALQAGNLSAAQQAFSAMSQLLQNFGSSLVSANALPTNAVNVSA
jgi:hypothetical protein